MNLISGKKGRSRSLRVNGRERGGRLHMGQERGKPQKGFLQHRRAFKFFCKSTREGED